MIVTLELPESAEAKIQDAAQRAGLQVPDYLVTLIVEHTGAGDKWIELLNSGGFDAGVSLSDEQTRRETIYG